MTKPGDSLKAAISAPLDLVVELIKLPLRGNVTDNVYQP
jgi:hypothetical protein